MIMICQHIIISELEEKVKVQEQELVELRPTLISDSAMKSKTKAQVPGATSGGIACPNCGGRSITHEKDRTEVLFVAAGTPVYGKRYKCKNCGNDWK